MPTTTSKPQRKKRHARQYGDFLPLVLSILFSLLGKKNGDLSPYESCLLATDANAGEACEDRMLMSNHRVSQEKSIFSSSRRAVRNSWSVNAPEIIRCLRACTASILSSTVPLTMNLLIETLFI